MVLGVLLEMRCCDVLQFLLQPCPQKQSVRTDLKVSAVQNKAERKCYCADCFSEGSVIVPSDLHSVVGKIPL